MIQGYSKVANTLQSGRDKAAGGRIESNTSFTKGKKFALILFMSASFLFIAGRDCSQDHWRKFSLS